MRSGPLALGLVVALAGVAGAAVRKGQRAEDFELKDRAGHTVRLSSLRGRVVLVDFWASWCEPCKKELPLLGGIAERLRGRGVEVVAINIDKDRGKAEAFLRDHAIRLNILWNPDGSVAERYEPPKMPTSYVIDKKGLCRYVNAGFEVGDEKRIEQELLELLGK